MGIFPPIFNLLLNVFNLFISNSSLIIFLIPKILLFFGLLVCIYQSIMIIKGRKFTYHFLNFLKASILCIISMGLSFLIETHPIFLK